MIEGFFVYGTLMKGQRRFECLSKFGIEDIQPATFTGTLWDTGNGYPALTWEPTIRTKVLGEFIRVKHLDLALKSIDCIEGFRFEDAIKTRNNCLYLRIAAHVCIAPDQDPGDGKRMTWAWTYLYDQPIENLTRIESGNWRDIIA